MNPWKLLDTAQTPGSGEELRLYQRGTEFSIKVGQYELMNSRTHASEDALASLACQKITKHPQARVLIGGLGMGYTVRSALDELGAKAEVAVAELVPEVVTWNQGFLRDLADNPLGDSRVTVHEADVAQMIRTARADYHAILLDVDNGPQGLIRQDNHWLYSNEGLHTALGALRPNGVLAIWSSGPSPTFVRQLRKAGFNVEEVGVRGHSGIRGKGGSHFIVWIAMRVG